MYMLCTAQPLHPGLVPKRNRSMGLSDCTHPSTAPLFTTANTAGNPNVHQQSGVHHTLDISVSNKKKESLI
jgi:hypothetical protein